MHQLGNRPLDCHAEAINGRGAFRRLGDVVGEDSRHEAAWLAFRDERRSDRVRAWLAAWLAEEGYDPVRPT